MDNIKNKKSGCKLPLNAGKSFLHTFYSLLLIAYCLLLLGSCKNKNQEVAIDPDVYYTCSMDPQVKENKPGKCPICKMELTMARKSSQKDKDEIELSAQQIQLGNIHVDTIGKEVIGSQVVLNATLNPDQVKTTAVSSRVMGRIEKLYFKNLGEYVNKGAKIFDLYSEELNNAKQEYVLAMEKKRLLDNAVVDFAQIIQSAKNKLLLWGMNEKQIDELSTHANLNSLTSFYSNAAGFITSLDIKEGDYVTEGGTVLRLADLSTLWAEAQVYSSQLSAISMYSEATVKVPDMPGTIIKGKVEFMNPEINPTTRINLVRVGIPNPNNRLRPGMIAYVTINNKQRNTLSLPIDAVMRDNRGASVWIQSGDHKFRYKMVEVGIESDNRIEIKSGLKAGDIVVTSGAYLLNSEYIFKQGSNPMEGMDMSKMKM